MRKNLTPRFLVPVAVLLLLLPPQAAVLAKEVEFKGVVKLVESHYRVKHKSIPLVARMGIKTAQTAVRLAGPRSAARIAEMGSSKIAIFEDQDFSSPSVDVGFATLMRHTLEPEWLPLVLVQVQKGDDQTYIYTKEAGEKFKVLIVQIGRRDGVVLQVDLRPQALVMLMKDPEAVSKTLTDEAADDSATEP